MLYQPVAYTLPIGCVCQAKVREESLTTIVGMIVIWPYFRQRSLLPPVEIQS